jgi:hypothetical protein
MMEQKTETVWISRRRRRSESETSSLRDLGCERGCSRSLINRRRGRRWKFLNGYDRMP